MIAKAGQSKKKKVLIAAAVLALALAVVFTIATRSADGEAVTYEEAQAGAVTMEQTLTAAGQIKAAASEEIAFSTSKYFAGMCVEEGDAVRKGQHLISYTDGTYEDAPDDGVVTEINAPETGSAADEDNVLILEYTDELVLEIEVPEDDISKISKGDSAKVTVNADSTKTFNGTISSVKAISADLLETQTDTAEAEEDDESGQPEGGSAGSGGAASETDASATYTVAMTLTNDGTLKTGMSGNCTITVSARKSVLAVPIEAVQFDGEQAYVELASGGGAVKTEVTTGESDANYVEIAEGLSEGDTVRIEIRR